MAEKNPGFVEFGAPVPEAEYDFFKEQFPQYGAVKWFINQALITFNEQVRQNPTTKDHVRKSVEEMVGLTRLARVAAGAGESSDV